MGLEFTERFRARAMFNEILGLRCEVGIVNI